MIEVLANKGALSKATAKDILEGVIDLINEQVRKEGRCSLPGLGTFTVSKRAGTYRV